MSLDNENTLARVAVKVCAWAERWFPDAYVFAVLALLIVVIATIVLGASPLDSAVAFGDGYWNLVPFTMQMSFVVIGGYVVAASPPVAALIDRLALLPRNGRAAVCLVTLLTMLLSMVHWGLSVVIGSLLVRALGRRDDLAMDYRAAAAGAYLGLGSVWAMGLSSSAAQLQANAASMPPALLQVSGVIPFSETIFLWQSGVLTLVLLIISVVVAGWSAPKEGQAVTARQLGVVSEPITVRSAPVPQRPGERLDHSAFLNLAVAAIGATWLGHEFWSKGFVKAIANLNTYNFLFLTIGLVLCWHPSRFLAAATRAIPNIGGILIQFPLYGGIANIMTAVKDSRGLSIAEHLAHFFTQVASHDTYPIVVGAYSAILGFFVPSGGGKWLVEAPYVMQAAKDLQVHLGWAVQVYNAAEALPNLINPFWMLPLLGILGLKARDLIGYTFVQFIVHVPLVLFLLWLLGLTLHYRPPVFS